MHASILRSALTDLDLSGMKIGVEGAGMLADVLGGWKTLAHLDVSFNGLGRDGAGRLAGGLGVCQALASLDLNKQQRCIG
eukprot:2232641-Rhodomonas_salina.1